MGNARGRIPLLLLGKGARGRHWRPWIATGTKSNRDKLVGNPWERWDRRPMWRQWGGPWGSSVGKGGYEQRVLVTFGLLVGEWGGIGSTRGQWLANFQDEDHDHPI